MANEEVNIVKVMATKMVNDLREQEAQIEKLKLKFPTVDRWKFNKLIDVFARTRDDLWRNCISNPMV